MVDLDLDEFVEIPGVPGYRLSRDGRVLGLGGSRLLSPQVHGSGYIAYVMKGKTYMLGRLLCEAFHGPAPGPDYVAVYELGSGTTSADSVRWGTRREARLAGVERRRALANALEAARPRRPSGVVNGKKE